MGLVQRLGEQFGFQRHQAVVPLVHIYQTIYQVNTVSTSQICPTLSALTSLTWKSPPSLAALERVGIKELLISFQRPNCWARCLNPHPRSYK